MGSTNEAQAAPIRLARLTSSAGILTKTICLDASGGLRKTTAAQLSDGSVENLSLESIDHFSALLQSLTCDQALTYGVCKRGSSRVMSERRWTAAGSPEDVVMRNREHFEWPCGPGILMLDYDPPAGNAIGAGEDLRQALYSAVPELEDVAHLWWPSASSCIFNVDTDSEVVAVRGQRVYVLISNAVDIPRISEIINARLWLSGHGRFDVSGAGSLLERTLVDGAVFQPERLDFAAGAKCEPPLEQRRGQPQRFGGSAPLDGGALLSLTDAEVEQVEREKTAARLRVREHAQAVKQQWIGTKSLQLQERRGLDEKTAMHIAQTAVENHRLMGDFVLMSRDGTLVMVADILDNRSLWNGERFHDPLEPDYPDDRIAWANLNSGLRPYLYSHAHGGCRYELCRTLATVEIAAGGTAIATEQVLRYMQEDGSYFERGAGIATVSESGEIQNLQLYALKHGLEKGICFEKWDGRKERMRPVDCPDEIARRVLDMRGSTGLRKLAGIVKWPTMTSAGRLLEKPGYDAETQLIFVNPAETPWPKVPQEPSRSQVLEALHKLWLPVSLFPFVDDSSRGICLAAMLTAVTRRTLPTAPAFMFAAPSAGSGKTLLGSCVVELAGGGAALALPEADTEVAKTLLSVLRKGSAALFFDNVTGVIDSKSLNAMLTAQEFDGRILGVSEMAGALPTNTLVVLTGNNARPGGDACRRMLVSYIDPMSETPYLREFEFNPLEVVRSTRMELIVAALTVLQGWVCAGRPRVASGSLASFDAWDGMIRQTVAWVGQLEREVCGPDAIGFGDPTARIQEQFAADEDMEALRALLEAWEVAQDGEGFKAGELYRLLDAARRWELHGTPDPHTALGLTLVAVMPKVLTPKGVGKWLKGVQGRIAGGRRLVGEHDASANSTIWRVQRA